MLKPLSISLRNFKSFRELNDFQFPDEGSLVFLTGTNEVDPELSSNGVGKSTLFDSLHWVFYGTSARGLKAGNVCTWGETGNTSVVCQLETGDGRHEISRTWRPNSLEIDGRSVSQEEVEELVGFNSVEFKSSVLMGQFNPFFLDLRPVDKLNLFTSVMNLEYWTEASSRAGSLSRDIENSDIPDLKSKLSNLKGVVEYQGKQLKILEEQSKNFERKKFSDLRNLELELSDRLDALKILEKEVSLARDRLDEAETELCSHENAREAILELRPVAPDDFIELELRKVALESRIEDKENILEIQGSGVCSLCGQTLPEGESRSDHLDVEKELENLKDDLRDVCSKMLSLKESLDEEERLFEDALKSNKKSILDARLLRGSKEKQYRSLSDKRNIAKNLSDSLRGRIHDVANSRNQAKEDIKRISSERDSNLKEFRALEKELLEAESLQKAVHFWVKGFRDVRLFLVEEALTSFEMESNQALLELGLTDWRISFDVEKETKSGGISRGFTVAIDSPFSEGLVPWEAWSGGEGQRLRLATNMGLANLIQDSKGVHSSLEVWDEPSQHLSEKGIDDLLEVLFSRAINIRKSVWVVDHSSLNYGGFDKTYRINKDKNNGSWIE